MKKNLPIILAAFVLPLLTATAQVQAASVQDLERKLKERDKVILELLERVEALERRVGVQQPAADPSDLPPAESDAGDYDARDSGQTPGVVVVDEEAAERALERSLTRQGALLLPAGVLEVEARASYARQEDSTPVFVPAAGEVFAGETERNVDDLTADLELRLGMPLDSQLEIGIPYRWREVESVRSVDFAPVDATSESGSGLGDLRVGLAKTLLKEGLRRPDLIGRITWNTDTGETRDNGVSLEGGFHEVRGSLTAIKRQDPVVFVGGLSYEYTFEEDRVHPGSIISTNFGGHIALSPETSLSLFLVAAQQEETEFFGSEVDGSDRTLGTFVLGGSTLLARGVLLNLSGGMGLTDDANDFSVSLSFTKRFRRSMF